MPAVVVEDITILPRIAEPDPLRFFAGEYEHHNLRVSSTGSVSMYTAMPGDGQALLTTRVSGQNVPIPFHGTTTLSSFQAAGIRSIHDIINPRRCYQLRFAESLAARSVKQNRIAVCFPNRGEIQRARSVQAEVHATRGAVSHQDSFIQRK